jgi:hypothetical protein
MAFENTKTEIDILLQELREQPDAPHDRYELYLTIMQKLNELKAYGMPLPADLVELENQLDREMAEERRDERAAVEREERAAERRQKR